MTKSPWNGGIEGAAGEAKAERAADFERYQETLAKVLMHDDPDVRRRGRLAAAYPLETLLDFVADEVERGGNTPENLGDIASTITSFLALNAAASIFPSIRPAGYAQMATVVSDHFRSCMMQLASHAKAPKDRESEVTS